MRLRQIAAPLKKQGIAQWCFGAGESGSQRRIGAFRLLERVLRLQSTGVQQLRIRRLEVRVMQGQSLESRPCRREVLLAVLRPRQTQQQGGIVFEYASQPTLVYLDRRIEIHTT